MRARGRLSAVGLAAALVLAVAAESSESHTAGYPGRNGRIAYTEFEGGGARIVAVTATGRSTRPLFASGGGDGDPAWSRDGKLLAFVRSTPDDRFQGVYTVTLGQSPRALTRNRSEPDNAVLDGHPQWSPSAREIMFHRYRAATETFGLYAVTTARPVRLRRLGQGFEPDWSPDGRRIAFAFRSGVADDFDIYVMDADGSSRRHLTNSPENETGPDWSPDGARIAFVRHTGGQEYDIWTMRSAGREQRRLTNAPGPDVDPAWSPDGRRIAFAGRRVGRSDIFVMNPNGSGTRRLTRKPFDEAQPAWQPLPRRR